jgi:hypothetical protein
MNTIHRAALAATVGALALAAGAVSATVDATRAAELGRSLTPVGAERAGNAAGTIPAWEGGITRPPANFRIGMFHPDPFAADRPKFSITRANLAQHRANMSPGQIAMFERYPTFRMDVYPTRRSASFPQRIYDFTRRNATQCRLVAEGEGVQNCAEGFPFPIPQNAHQLMWNHKLKYKGVSGRRWVNRVAPTPTGQFQVIRLRERLLGLYYKPGNTTENINNILLYFKQEVLGPARLAGQVLLVHETLNARAAPRQAWIYNPGQRRVRRAPNVAYDNPATASDGLSTNDMADMFNGAKDRFEWSIVGKREMFVPYNSYKAHSDNVRIADLVRPGHLNPDFMRYELHRVWVVEARLRAGARHINSRRTFYLDEDSYQILKIDHYDGQGNIWRVSEAPSINYYEVPTFWSTIEVHYDLRSGRYLAGLLDNEEDRPFDFGYQATPADFSPQNLRAAGVR